MSQRERRASCCSPTARELFDNTYQRFLVKTFRDQLGFNDVPIKLYLRAKRREDGPDVDEGGTPAPETPVRKKQAQKPAGASGKDRKRAQEPELWRDL